MYKNGKGRWRARRLIRRMKTLAFILNIIFTAIEAFWFYYLPEIFLERRFSAKNRLSYYAYPALIYLAHIFLTLILNEIDLTSAYTTIAVMLFACIAIMGFWKADFIMAMAIVGSYCFFILFSTLIDFRILGALGGEELIYAATSLEGKERCLYLAAAGLFWNTLLFFLSRKIRLFNGKMEKTRLAVITGLGFLGLLFYANSILESYNVVVGWQINFVIVGISGISCTYYFYEKNKMMNMEKASLAKVSEEMEEKYQRISSYYTERAKIYHDMKHHLRAIQELADRSHNQELVDYVSEILPDKLSHSRKVWTGIDIVDIILMDKSEAAKAKNIDMTIEADRLPDLICLTNREWCCVIANLLDNCLESAVTRIAVKINLLDQGCLLQFENDGADLEVTDRRPQTKKADRQGHGFGLENVEQVIQAHGGSVKYHSTGEEFSLVIYIPFQG